MVSQVTTICKSAFYRLRKIRLIRKHLTFDSAQLLVQVLVTSKLDYCNSLLNGLAKNVIKQLQPGRNKLAYYAPLQRMQNTAACVLLLFRPRSVILHLLPCKPPLAPGLNVKYLLLLSRLSMDLLLLKLKISLLLRPLLWNSLPQHIRDAGSLDIFKKNI